MKKPYTLLNKAEPYLWILPSIILMSIFIIIPIGFVFRMSLSQVTKAGLVKGFIGFNAVFLHFNNCFLNGLR